MTPDVLAALARVPSPVERFALTDGRTMFACDCGTDWCPDGWPGEPQGDRAEHHRPDCWWPPFVAAREALAVGVTVEGACDADALARAAIAPWMLSPEVPALRGLAVDALVAAVTAAIREGQRATWRAAAEAIRSTAREVSESEHGLGPSLGLILGTLEIIAESCEAKADPGPGVDQG
jgi:hypothetical protein